MMRFLLLQALGAFASGSTFQLISKEPLTLEADCPEYLEPSLSVSPNFITHISPRQPDRNSGAQTHVYTTPGDIISVVNFNMPNVPTRRSCKFVFLFPEVDQVQHPFRYEGGGSFFLHGYNTGECANDTVTYNHQPKSGHLTDFPPIHMQPGYAYTFGVSPCSHTAGGCVSGSFRSNDTHFSCLQSTERCPMGFYMIYDGDLEGKEAETDL